MNTTLTRFCRKSQTYSINFFGKTSSVDFRMSVAGVYYGISLGVGQLTGELYRDFVLSSAIEMPSIAAAIILMQR